ncbi:MAG: hypothetical protein JW778_02790 [Candidatus Altiarchaeota archaeon]|nr:hypothetical protein [Candidatus Altiarchaeota archaeon]
MDQLALFVDQVIILLLMLTGMLVGESATSSLFGYVRGKTKQLLYLLFFVVFIVFGNYLPSLMGLPNLSFLDSIILFSVWGFLSVFFSRTLIFLLDHSTSFLRGLNKGGKNKITVDAQNLIRHLRQKGLNWKEINSILSDLTGSSKKAESLQKKAENGRLNKKIPINPHELTVAVHGIGFTAEEITDLLVRAFSLTPEQAANIWREST